MGVAQASRVLGRALEKLGAAAVALQRARLLPPARVGALGTGPALAGGYNAG